jgi:hypothetical protein
MQPQNDVSFRQKKIALWDCNSKPLSEHFFETCGCAQGKPRYACVTRNDYFILALQFHTVCVRARA